MYPCDVDFDLPPSTLLIFTSYVLSFQAPPTDCLSKMHRSLVLPLLFLFGLQLVAAQFNFFENMFGQQQHHQQQQQRSGASQWAAYSDSGTRPLIVDLCVSALCLTMIVVACSQYLCPETLDCVDKPVDCPCPNPEDIKCIVPDAEGDVDDATVICTRGQKECTEVERLMRKGAKSRK
jgi:hypothetical protein